MAAMSPGETGHTKVFSGENEDSEEYRRFKVWCTNKMMTMDKLPSKARGAYVYTLLAGKALECVEHLSMDTYQVEDGDQVIWKLLDERFPVKAKTDELGELLTEIFQLRSKDNESLKTWVARSTELFDRLARKTKVELPSEARGWIILHKAGLSEAEKAIALARAGGSLKRDDISQAMRSCFPDKILSSRKSVHAANLVEDGEIDLEEVDEEPNSVEDFADIEMFLAEHQREGSALDGEAFLEKDVAEIMAVTWKEKRQELAKLQRSRNFKQVKETKRAFRVEIEEMKKRTRCHRCGKLGHWSRECRQPRNAGDKGPSSSSSKTSQPSSTAGAALVQQQSFDFIAAVENLSLVERLRQLVGLREKEMGPIIKPAPDSEVLLVSSPGYGVLDSGCGKTIIGEKTLSQFQDLLRSRGLTTPVFDTEINHFRYGNGHSEISDKTVKIPVQLGGRHGAIKAAIVKGSAPLLISRTALQILQASLDFKNNTLTLFDDRIQIPLQLNEAGQYVVRLLPEEPVATMSPDEQVEHDDDSVPEPESAGLPQGSSAQSSSEMPQVWSREDSGCQFAPFTNNHGPRKRHVMRRIVRCALSKKVLLNQPGVGTWSSCSLKTPLPDGYDHVITELWHDDPKCTGRSMKTEAVDSMSVGHMPMTNHQLRQLKSQVTQGCAAVTAEQQEQPKLLVAEVFSPPRFATVAEERGFQAKSVDIKLGVDLLVPANRRRLKEELRVNAPELLTLSPPCTNEGGWFHLNSTKMDRFEYLKKKTQSRILIRFCAELFQQQVSLGGRALWEHPTGSKIWGYAEVEKLCRRYHVVKVHMCQYGLKLPDSPNFIRKSTKLLVSHEDMKTLGRTCHASEDHHQHDVVAGSYPQIGSVSVFAGQYTREFVEAVLMTIPAFRARALGVTNEVLEVTEDVMTPYHWEVLAAAKIELQKTGSELKAVVDRLHRNLGHPPNHDLIRILRHAQASDEAIQIAKEHKCSFCDSRVKPRVPIPAQTSRASQFNQQIGVDVKYLVGWKPNQKVKALNIVDQASCFQRVIPFFEPETAVLLRQLLEQHWISWTGPPAEVVLDAAQTNLADPMFLPAETEGTQMRVIPADAHWQLGRTENHGGWFGRILSKVVDEHSPKNQEEWLQCVRHAHVKNEMIQSYGFTPHQFVFGKNPRVPSDLLDEPLHVVSATASLHDSAAERAQAIRQSARKAVLELQDSKALRSALLARPRVSIPFKPGDLVAYWISQKWIQGELHNQGRWYGTAVVLGYIGKNLLIAHRKHILRCAPEQIRYATSEEKSLLSTPQVELLGIKDMIEGGTFRSQQFTDLTSQSYPTMAPLRSFEHGTPSQEEPRSEPVQRDSDENPAPPEAVPPEPEASANSMDIASPHPEHVPPSAVMSDEHHAGGETSEYGPIRRRVCGKDGPGSLYRPPAMRTEDFIDVIREAVPQMIEQLNQGQKRDHDHVEPDPNESSSAEPASHRARIHETLTVQHLDAIECWSTEGLDIEVLIAEYIKKKMAKELPHSKNPPAIQRLVEEGKSTEWKTMLSKPDNVKVHYGRKAKEIREKFSHRFIGSRFVLTRKPLEEGATVDPQDPSTFSVKGRWCLQGHLDPDLHIKAQEGKLKSPTLSQLGRMALMQVLSSQNWSLQLGDIRGAFLEAGPLESRFRPLYAHQPPGGIPGLPEDAVIEVCGNIYGQNDAPASWFRTFDETLQQIKWKPSCFDPCLYQLRNAKNELVGVLGIHVDDCALGGFGTEFETSVKQLKARFPFRKWRVRQGEFCGAMYSQQDDGTIQMSMKASIEKIKPANIPKTKNSDALLEDHQVKVLRAINGSLNWVTSQARPDLAAQTSFSQQSFPHPRIKHLRNVNTIVRRAKQHADLCISFKPIPLQQLVVCCHSDAAFANVGNHTQAGFMIAFAHTDLNDGLMTAWNPAAWRSYRLARAVSSTLAAESQAMATASGTVEWMCLLLHEIINGPFDVRESKQVLQHHKPILVTDCKSLYDHLHSPSSPTAVEDRRTSIDITIIKESVRTLNASVRWVPTDRMLADSLTKDAGDPIDLLRACIRNSSYQISPEQDVLDNQAAEKQRRLNLSRKTTDVATEVSHTTHDVQYK